MKLESEPITDDEWLLRLVWETNIKQEGTRVAAAAFEPLPLDTDGLSLFRRACLPNPLDVLLAVAEDKRSHYAVVQVPVSILASLHFTLHSKQNSDVPGHVVIPELNIDAYKANKASFTRAKVKLADVASEDGNIVRRPTKPELD